jgi:hydroxymethylbilane synthase
LLTKKHYKIGTRGSLLALTQCNQVKDQLEALTGDTFELVVIKTQGDMITNAPLWQLDGKDFFTKELDEALISGQVDLVVHSYKDLGSERPADIMLAAVTKRSFAHDILLIKDEVIPTIKTKSEFVVGTSSPRRIVNIEKNLSEYLPGGKNVLVKTKVLRGNVNTRIQKLRDGEFDAIVLALPGIERLALTESSRIELERLLYGINFMILPQSTFTSSASQGALGIECRRNREDNGELLLKLNKMEDATTKEEVSRERKAFNSYGGGCHLAVGINVRKIKGHYLHTHHGVLNDQTVSVSHLEGRDLPVFVTAPRVFNGNPIDDQIVKKVNLPHELIPALNLYVTSKYCLDAVKSTEPKTLWAAGTKTMKDLASLGFWVNGTADSLGDEEMHNLLSSKAVGIMMGEDRMLTVLSNDKATSTLSEDIIPCYTRTVATTVSEEFKTSILNAEVFYWTSFFQYEAYVKMFPQISNRIHTCGIGKTFQQFQNAKINVLPFASMEEFKNWTQV